MPDANWQKVREVFDSALCRQPEERQNFVNKACGEDKVLLAEVESLPKWKAAAQRALEIDEGLADAHLAMAHIYFYYERDWAKAEREFERAVELNPNSTDAHKYYGLFLASKRTI
jgi:Tfp pilus assembly protein PilF